MAVDTLKAITRKKAELAGLEQQYAIEQHKKLAGLHKEAGFGSTVELIAALKGLVSKQKPGIGKKNTVLQSGKRTKITAPMRAKIVAALKGGAKGTAVAEEYGISIPSIQNIKKENGLTKVTAATKKANKTVKKAAKKTAKKK